MTQFDLPVDRLRTYRSTSVEPEDFDAFWTKTLDEARAHELDARFEPVATGLATVEVFDVTFAGFGGHPVKGWFVLPPARPNRFRSWWSSSGTAADGACRTPICCGPRPGSRTS